jgi:hypothetical protein
MGVVFLDVTEIYLVLLTGFLTSHFTDRQEGTEYFNIHCKIYLCHNNRYTIARQRYIVKGEIYNGCLLNVNTRGLQSICRILSPQRFLHLGSYLTENSLSQL